MNSDNLFLVKEISGCVKAKYLRDPTTLRYGLASTVGVKSMKNKGSKVLRGVDTSLASSM